MQRGSDSRGAGLIVQRFIERLPRRDRYRLDPGRRPVIAMLTVAIVTVAITGGWLLLQRPKHLAAAAVSAESATATGSQPAGGSLATPLPTITAAASANQLVVDVVGKVRRPGVYRLPVGSRVGDAVQAAGGARPGTDLTSVNLARKVSDGEQLAIGVNGAPTAADPAGTGAAAGPIDLNTASTAQLDALPGVGPVLAQHIVDWRAAHGRFDTVDQLNSVSGIGDAKYADLKDLVTVG